MQRATRKPYIDIVDVRHHAALTPWNPSYWLGNGTDAEREGPPHNSDRKGQEHPRPSRGVMLEDVASSSAQLR